MSFEKFNGLLNRELLSNNIVPSLKSQLHSIANRHFYNFKPFKVFSPVFSKNDIKILQNLRNNKSIILCKPDKGRGVVIMNKSDYLSKMYNILNDTTKFKEIKNIDPFLHTLRTEDKINRFIKKFNNNEFISNKKIGTVSGSNPGILYGLPKVHKNNTPVRPILAAYNTSTYNIAQKLVPELSHITTNDYTISNSFEFAKEITSFKDSDKFFMVSFDIESLYTNIPLKETIEICINKIFNNVNIFLGFDKKQFKSLLEVITNNTFFTFNNKLYQQIDGIAMGSPIAPTLANIFFMSLRK